MKVPWVIANPQAAGGRGAKVIPRLEGVLTDRGIDFALHRTKEPGHARELAYAALGAASRILVVGGDGTIHEVADGLITGSAETRLESGIPPLAVLPVGTGNDFFRMVRSDRGVAAAVRALETGVPRWFEVGEVRWNGESRHFVNLIGIGIDVEVLRRRSAFRRLPGLMQYLAALGSALVRYEPVPLSVTLRSGGHEPIVLDTPVLLAATTVGPSVGGGFLLSPKAVPDDGLLDLFHAKPLGPLKVLRYLPDILRGAGTERPEIALGQGTEVRIERMDGRGLTFELDGELMETSSSRLDIYVRPATLPVLEVAE